MMLRANPRRRAGLVSLASLFVLLLFLALLAVVWNASRAAHRKMEAQNAADAAAQAAGLQAARAMNEVTAINHLLGELLAVCVLAYTPGGMELEDAVSGKTGPGQFSLGGARQVELTDAYVSASLWGKLAGAPVESGVDDVVRTTTSDSGAAIGHARRRLKDVAAWALRLHAAGCVLVSEKDLNMGTQGKAVVLLTQEVERAVVAEWRVLDALEAVAKKKLLPLKWLCNHTLIPALYEHCKLVVEGAPKRMEDVAAERGEAHGATGSLFPNTSGRGRPLALPVEPETAPAGGWENSQFVRAATPWVQYWRKPVLAFADELLVLSRYGSHYLKWSNHFTPLMARWQGPDYGVFMYALKGRAGKPKGREPWTTRDGSARADALFALLGFAHQDAPALLGAPLFRQPQPDGYAAFAQAMLYNANPQEPDKLPPAPLRPGEWQPRVAWDTLNWDPEVWVPEFGYGDERDRGDHVRQPRVKTNWRAKLAPGTLLAEAPGSQADKLNAILERTEAANWLANTH